MFQKQVLSHSLFGKLPIRSEGHRMIRIRRAGWYESVVLCRVAATLAGIITSSEEDLNRRNASSRTALAGAYAIVKSAPRPDV